MTAAGTVSADRVTEALDRSGQRLTGPRRTIAELIAARTGHFTAAELVADAARQRTRIGRATVFRALDLFASLGLVERLDLPGGKHAYVACDPAHHHHAICTRCSRSFDVSDLGLSEALESIDGDSRFQVTAHRLEVFGLCADCQHGPGGSSKAQP